MRRPEAKDIVYWYGGFQPKPEANPESNWQWVTGEEWNYAGWNSPSDPNNAGGIEQYLISLHKMVGLRIVRLIIRQVATSANGAGMLLLPEANI